MKKIIAIIISCAILIGCDSKKADIIQYNDNGEIIETYTNISDPMFFGAGEVTFTDSTGKLISICGKYKATWRK